ncbi:pyruvate ferredoxin oxidoreductase, gamma subunit [Geoglobus acetivorans]|uniref:pyruvate synthase n=2 Tax=Geoglobus acetivorans TaxID=565033 RepID=A0A0A7GCL5_GEOAI|nr:pyruvate ferredoxin oxidoreductase, gamma subunit [Geoglobus acetivorans]
MCRGGQGGITFARILARAGLYEGYYTQAMPQFGAERRGAKVMAHLRVSETPIRKRSRITQPDILVVFDDRLDFEANVSELVVVNTDEELDDPGMIAINASSIALNFGLVVAGWPVVNSAMSGAVGKILGFSFESISKGIEEEIASKVDKNIKAAEMAYGMIK